MATYTFAQIPDIIAKYEKRMEAVVKQSAQEVALEVKGRSPRVTGFLRASLMASTNNMPMIDRNAKPQTGVPYQEDNSQIALVIAGASLGEPIYLGFVAGYADYVEYGVNGHEGRGMVRLTAQRWPAIVNKVVKDAIARMP